jgi:hypothetical protein
MPKRKLSAPRPHRRKSVPTTLRLRGLAKVSAKKTDRALFEEAILADKRR